VARVSFDMNSPRAREIGARLMATEWYVGLRTCGRPGYASLAAALVIQGVRDELRGGDITERHRARARERMRRLRGAS
jgi:hypothetical protein